MFIATQTHTSSVVLERIVEMLGDSVKVTAEALRGILVAAPLPGTNILDLRSEGPDPKVLPRILTAWIESYRITQEAAYEGSSAAAIEEARGTAEQLKQDIAARRQEVDQFRKKHGIVSLEREEHQAGVRMKSLNAALTEARNREVDAEARLSAAKEGVAAGKPAIGATERSIVVELEKRMNDLREKMKDLESEYTPQYLALDPKYKAMRTNLARIQQQLEQERKASTGQALLKIEAEVASAHQAVARLQQEIANRKRDTQEFTAKFAEHAALTAELNRTVEAFDAAKVRLAEMEKTRKKAGPKLVVLDEPVVPSRPDRPNYLLQATISVGGAAALGLAAVWFVEFFFRSGVRRDESQPHPIINIAYPAAISFDPAMPLPGPAPVAAALPGSALRLPDATVPRFPRELSAPEVRALWTAAAPDARLVIGSLFGGLSPEEIVGLRYEHLDQDASVVYLPDAGRSIALRDPLRRMLVERRAARGGTAPLAGGGGHAVTLADVEGLITCAACDAGLSNPADISTEVLRHTYFAYLVRQGARLSEIAEFVGHIPPAAFRDYGRLSPPGPGLPMEEIDPVFPALREQRA
jgi:integrase